MKTKIAIILFAIGIIGAAISHHYGYDTPLVVVVCFAFVTAIGYIVKSVMK